MNKKGPKNTKKTTTTKTEAKKAPKKLMSSYFLFAQDKREEVAAGLKKGENINKKLGEIWKSYTDAQKKPYQDQYLKDKEEIDLAKKQKKENAAKGLKAAREAAKKKKETEKA
ncbi:HMG box domain-containing protein [Entamoeba marina]